MEEYERQKQEKEREEKDKMEKRKETLAMLQYQDEGYIELVLRVLASMCDGQNTTLQVVKQALRNDSYVVKIAKEPNA